MGESAVPNFSRGHFDFVIIIIIYLFILFYFIDLFILFIYLFVVRRTIPTIGLFFFTLDPRYIRSEFLHYFIGENKKRVEIQPMDFL